MRRWSFLLALLLLAFDGRDATALFLHPGGGAGLVSEEEFAGPFASWACVRSTASGTCGAAAAVYCNAAGDGSTDDTAAIQACINDLPANASVLWFPAGNYLIKHTLSLVGQAYVSLIGAAPSTTAILWGGNSASSAASFTGSIATAGTGASQVTTLAVSGLTGTIVPGQILACSGCVNYALSSVVWSCSVCTGSDGIFTVVASVATPVTGTGQTVGITGATATGGNPPNGNFAVSSFTDNQHFVLSAVAPNGYYGTTTGSPVITGSIVPTLVWKQLSGSIYQLAPYSAIALTKSSVAMTTTDRSMLWIGGVAQSRFDRLTFNGQSNATIVVDQSKPDGSANYFDTGNEYADDVFESAGVGLGVGLNCGSLIYGCAETEILRDTFSGNLGAGIQMLNFNALDMFVWYSQFLSNGYGITNCVGAGNFRVFNSVFNGSILADGCWGNTGVFTMRGNYSSGSNYFWYGGGAGGSNPMLLQGNVVLDNTSIAATSGGNSVVANRGSIFDQDVGPLTLIDNTIRSLSVRRPRSCRLMAACSRSATHSRLHRARATIWAAADSKGIR